MPPEDPTPLTYAEPPRPGHSPWGLIGFGVALLTLIGPVLVWWMIWVDTGQGGHVSVGATPLYYAQPAVAILLCVMGLRGKRPKLFPVLGISIAVFAAGAAALAASRVW